MEEAKSDGARELQSDNGKQMGRPGTSNEQLLGAHSFGSLLPLSLIHI